jgi:hypothetical protein
VGFFEPPPRPPEPPYHEQPEWLGPLDGRSTLWLWPLAPEGAVEFVCEWPALGIELSRIEVAASLLRDAAARSRTLW